MCTTICTCSICSGAQLNNNVMLAFVQGFFRRCYIQGLTQQCSNGEKCAITPMTRNSCQYCRFKKCVAVGMSRGGEVLFFRPPLCCNRRRPYAFASCLSDAVHIIGQNIKSTERLCVCLCVRPTFEVPCLRNGVR